MLFNFSILQLMLGTQNIFSKFKLTRFDLWAHIHIPGLGKLPIKYMTHKQLKSFGTTFRSLAYHEYIRLRVMLGNPKMFPKNSPK